MTVAAAAKKAAKRTTGDLSEEVLQAMGAELFKRLDPRKQCKLPRGALREIQDIFNLSYNTVRKVWNRARERFPENGEIRFVDTSHNRVKRSVSV